MHTNYCILLWPYTLTALRITHEQDTMVSQPAQPQPQYWYLTCMTVSSLIVASSSLGGRIPLARSTSFHSVSSFGFCIFVFTSHSSTPQLKDDRTHHAGLIHRGLLQGFIARASPYRPRLQNFTIPYSKYGHIVTHFR